MSTYETEKVLQAALAEKLNDIVEKLNNKLTISFLEKSNVIEIVDKLKSEFVKRGKVLVAMARADPAVQGRNYFKLSEASKFYNTVLFVYKKLNSLQGPNVFSNNYDTGR